MANELEIAWLAGLIEGEGSFCAGVWHQRPTSRARFRIQLRMTDLDVIEHAQRAFPGAGSITTTCRTGCKDIYAVRWYGLHAEALARAILPYMGARRSECLREILAMSLSHQPKAAQEHA